MHHVYTFVVITLMRILPMLDLKRTSSIRRTLCLAVVIVALAACERQPPTPVAPVPAPSAATHAASATDAYDLSEMDFKPGPATLTSEPHTGPFAAGDALSTGASLKPLSPASVKEVRLDTTHKIIEIAPGVQFSAWT